MNINLNARMKKTIIPLIGSKTLANTSHPQKDHAAWTSSLLADELGLQMFKAGTVCAPARCSTLCNALYQSNVLQA